MKIKKNNRCEESLFGFKEPANFETLLIVGFFFLGFIGIVHHEMWRDEFQAWLLARDSSSIPNLIGNLRHEGHPGLWHLCLYLISRFTHNPLFMQIFHLLIATGVVVLFVKFSPFKKTQKALFTFGYFPFYEYAIISRNYGLGVLLIFLFCALFPKRNKYLPFMAISLALLANTNAYGLIISFTLTLTLLLEFFLNKQAFKFYLLKQWSLVIVVSGWIVSWLQIVRPFEPERAIQRIESLTTGSSNLSDKTLLNELISEIIRAGHTLSSIWRAYVPIPDVFRFNFWGSNIISNDFLLLEIGIIKIPLGHIIACCFSVVLLVISVKILIQKPLALFAYILGTFSILLFDYLIHFGGLRHHGNLFILLVACLWIARYTGHSNLFERLSQRTKKLDRRYANSFFTAIFCIHLISGVFAYSMDLAYPFSMSRDTSRFIESHQLDNLLIVGTSYREVATLSGYLDKKIFYPERNGFGSFWTTREKELESEDELFEIIEKLRPKSETDILLVLTEELKSNRQKISSCQLEKFKEGIVSEEQFYLYLIPKNTREPNCIPKVSKLPNTI